MLKCSSFKTPGFVSVWHQTHLSPDSYWEPGVAKIMPAGFQQLGAEVISSGVCYKQFVNLAVPVWRVSAGISVICELCNVYFQLWKDFTHGTFS